MARKFTPRQLDDIVSVHSCGSSVAQIVSKLRETTNAVVLNKDVYHALSRAEKKYYDGLSETQDLLMALQGNSEFTFNLVVDHQTQLSAITFACKRSLAQFSKMSFVLLMDATYKTNKFNMPLLLLSSVDPFGQTYVVACCLLRNETTLSHNTALSSFKQLFGLTVPIVNSIITDQETTLTNAIAGQLPDSSHQLCRWHLQANMRRYV